VFYALNRSGEVVYLVLNGLVLCVAFEDRSPQERHVLLVDTDKIIEHGKCADFCEIVCDDFTFVHVEVEGLSLRMTP